MEDPLLFMAGNQDGTPPSSQPSSLPHSLNKDDADITLLFGGKKSMINLDLSGQIPNLRMQSKNQNSIPRRKMDASQVYLSMGLRIIGTSFA